LVSGNSEESRASEDQAGFRAVVLELSSDEVRIEPQSRSFEDINN
jgi:hypothetical protein